jgi:mRNA-degrading endonuclease toxin of MazEF toxin-antitoxin module
VALPSERTGLPRDSVANVSQNVAIDRALLTERVGHLSVNELELLLSGIDLVLGRE